MICKKCNCDMIAVKPRFNKIVKTTLVFLFLSVIFLGLQLDLMLATILWCLGVVYFMLSSIMFIVGRIHAYKCPKCGKVVQRFSFIEFILELLIELF